MRPPISGNHKSSIFLDALVSKMDTVSVGPGKPVLRQIGGSRNNANAVAQHKLGCLMLVGF